MGLIRKAGEGTPHGQRGRSPNVDAIDLPDRGGAQPEGQRAAPDEAGQSLPLPRAQRLRVSQAPQGPLTGREHHRRRHDRPRKRPAPHLIQAGHDLDTLRPERAFAL